MPAPFVTDLPKRAGPRVDWIPPLGIPPPPRPFFTLSAFKLIFFTLIRAIRNVYDKLHSLSFLKEKKIEYGPFMEVLYKITAVVF